MTIEKRKKRVVVEIDDHIHSEWMMKLYDDELTQTRLFRAIMEAYITDDPLFRAFLEAYKEKAKISNRARRYRVSKNVENSKKLREKLTITEDELDNIFDLIESHHPEL
jgi:hypothetical protein